MGHSDVVTVDEAKWMFPPFSATRDGGWVYARGTVDDKDNLTGGLMTMLLLKRYNVPLDRDVIFHSEAGEEGSSNFGMQFMVSQHYPEIESEYCLAEGGGAIRIGGVAVLIGYLRNLLRIATPVARLFGALAGGQRFRQEVGYRMPQIERARKPVAQRKQAGCHHQ